MSSYVDLNPSNVRHSHDWQRRTEPLGNAVTKGAFRAQTALEEKRLTREWHISPGNHPETWHDYTFGGIDIYPTAPSSKLISAGGTGTVAATYTPESSDKGTKIVFIQVMRELVDGAPAKPSASDAGFSYQDADTTSDFYHVDYVSGEADPYYNGDDPRDIGTQGNAVASPKVNATMNDTPHYDDATFPPGKSHIRYEFRDAAFSAAGADAGTYYAYADWTYDKVKGGAEATAIGSTRTGHPGSQFASAVNLWNSNHGFPMPGSGRAVIGGVIGALGGAAVGAGIGALFGGPIGAAVGGIVGAIAGGVAGGIIGARR